MSENSGVRTSDQSSGLRNHPLVAWELILLRNGSDLCLSPHEIHLLQPCTRPETTRLLLKSLHSSRVSEARQNKSRGSLLLPSSLLKLQLIIHLPLTCVFSRFLLISHLPVLHKASIWLREACALMWIQVCVCVCVYLPGTGGSHFYLQAPEQENRKELIHKQRKWL